MRPKQQKAAIASSPATLGKSPSGIKGLDEITGGGLPTGRPTLICGAAGCGKTLMAAEFVVRGAAQYNEPGAIILFEETAEELTANMRSIGYDLDAMQSQGQLALDFIRVDPAELVETGSYDLEGLFIRIGHAIDSVGAKRVALDTIETLFSDIANHAILRAELRRLFRWLKDRGVTAVITGERGEKALTRYGLEEYVADCVILLDHRIVDQVSTRRLRVVKYRDSAHGTNEYPFLIGARGISVLPITSLTLDHEVFSERVSTGINGLDMMLVSEAKSFSADPYAYAATLRELLAELEQELALLAATEAEQLDTTLLIHPLAMTEFLDYHFFLAETEALIRNNGYDGLFQIAGLHPQYEFAGSDPDDVANYTNRAPYPMLHLLRESSIDRAVAAFPDAAEIFERNIETMEKLGHAGWKKLWLG